MGNIREVLTLQDNFSSGLNKYIKMMEQGGMATKETAMAEKALTQQSKVYTAAVRMQTAELQREKAAAATRVAQARSAVAVSKMQTAQMRAAAAASRAAAAASRAKAAEERAAAQQSRAAAAAQRQYNQAMKEGSQDSSKLVRSLKSLAGGYIGLQGLKGILNLSDSLVTTTARINMMNDGLQTTGELNQMIFASANRSRGSYAETAAMVSKLGTLAGDAFGSSKEIVAFAEQLNKQMALSGTSTAEAQGAMIQLTQAMASGTLRGEELNSVMEQMPMIANTIADYMGVTKGEIRALASEGKITATVVKNAMFAAADEVNAKFEEMPVTWGQVWTKFQNYGTMALRPVLLGLSFLAQHIEIIAPLVLAAGAAFGVFQIAAHSAQIATAVTKGFSTAVTLARIGIGMFTRSTSAASAAQLFFNGTLLACPITWIVMGFALIIGAIYAIVAGYNHFADASVSATGIVIGAMYTLGAFVYNTIANMYNGFAVFGNFLMNVFVDPVAAVKVLFYDLAQTVLSYLLNIAKGVESVVNKIPGVKVDMTSGLQGWVTSLGERSAAIKSASGLKDYYPKLKQIDYGSAFQSGYKKGSGLFDFGGSFGGAGGLGSFGGAMPALDNIGSQLGGIGKDVGSIKKSVDMSQEDVKMIVDMASQKYVNKINLTAQTPVITVHGANTGDTEADRKKLADTLKVMLLEQAAAGSYRSTARTY